jgi:hypothetical protein
MVSMTRLRCFKFAAQCRDQTMSLWMPLKNWEGDERLQDKQMLKVTDGVRYRAAQVVL